MTKYILSFSLCIFFMFPCYSQAPVKPNSAEIHEAIKKLNFLGSVLYLAAHPDDENTRMISYFSNEVHARTAYLSITRGDGGQNLIGPEIRELLGIIRTNELLKARETDGGEQFFTRANDFGYSKHPDETLDIWNKEMVMNDVVKVIRKFKPDIIINRFNAESAGKTHGHHTSSAMLSTEAFDLAADPSYKTELYQPWTTQRLFFNTHWWFYGSRESFEKVDKSEMLWFDTGVYYPSFGLSNSEIASLSRSMHKSQGFGSTGVRGSDKEYVQLLKGKMPTNKNNVFEGVDTSWLRVEGGESIKRIMDKVEKDFDFRDPSRSLPELLKAYVLIKELKDEHWRELKLKQIKELLASCSGLYLEGAATNDYATRGEDVSVKIEAINRSEQKMKLIAVELLPHNISTVINKDLNNNISINEEMTMHVSDKANLTSPYWLEEKGSLGMYMVKDHSLIGNPISKAAYRINFKIDFEGTLIDFEKDVIYKFNDPVKGEVYQPFEIVPDAVSHIASKVVIFNDDQPKEIPVKIKSFKNSISGLVQLSVPEGWKVSPKQLEFELNNRGEELDVFFTVVPTKGQSEGYMRPLLSIDGKDLGKSMVEINYDHIPKQSVLLPSESKVVRLNLDKKGESIAYIKGAGDEVPKYLKQIGYKVTEIAPENISVSNLLQYDAVILGIRAYNTVPELKLKQTAILSYVEKGGNVIVQYNTSHSLLVEDNLAPYELKLSRDRITDENAKVTFVNEDHEVLNYPNKISSDDFEGWVQERGLYFPNKWGKEFSPILSFQENGDEPMEGSLLVAKFGKGHYIYTGLSFFRELPAGVPGAYKLLTNMISIGKNDFESDLKE